MYLAFIKDTPESIGTSCIYDDIQDLIHDTFSPECEYHGVELKAHGKTYAERKESIRNIALAYSYGEYPDLSYYDLSVLQDFFTKYGKRYGLLDEFRTEEII